MPGDSSLLAVLPYLEGSFEDCDMLNFPSESSQDAATVVTLGGIPVQSEKEKAKAAAALFLSELSEIQK